MLLFQKKFVLAMFKLYFVILNMLNSLFLYCMKLFKLLFILVEGCFRNNPSPYMLSLITDCKY